MHRLIFVFVLASWANAAENRSGEEAVELSYWCVHPAGRRAELSPVILQHGLGLDRRSWDGIYEVIALQTNRTVCLTDARNHGLSPRTEAFSLRLMSEDTIRLLDTLNVSRAILVGHSMGGKTSVISALDHPGRVEKLVVEDMRANSFEPLTRLKTNVSIGAMTDALALIPENATTEEAGDIVLRTIQDAIKQAFGADVGEAEAAMWRDSVERVDGRWRYKYEIDLLFQIMRDPDFVDGSLDGRYEGEALFIYGKLSESKVGETVEEIMELFPKALLVGVEGAGHMVHNDKPRQFLSAVIDFINGS